MRQEEIEGYIAGIFKNPKIEAGAGVKTIPAVVRGRILATSPTKRFGVFRDALALFAGTCIRCALFFDKTKQDMDSEIQLSYITIQIRSNISFVLIKF